MRSARQHAALAVLAVLSMVLAACGTAAKMPGTGTNTGGQALRVLAFYDPRAQKPTGAVEHLLVANRAAVSDLSPLWYQVMPDGSLRDLSTNALKTWARRAGLQLMPLVVNNRSTSAFLLNPTARTRAVNALAALVQRQNYDGLNIDFEQIKTSARGPFVQFMRQLHQKLSAMHKKLTVDVIPSGSRRAANSGAYNYAALAKNADEVVLMTYDAHDNGSAPGPIAPLAWVQRRVNVALADGIPPSRLLLGIADYGYDWPLRSGGGHGQGVEIGVNQVDQLLAARHITPVRSSDGEAHFTYTKNGVTHVVWYEDGRAILPKVALAHRDHLSGLALWMVGFETAHYWHSLRAAAGTATTTPVFTPPTPVLQPALRGAAHPASSSSSSSSSSTSRARVAASGAGSGGAKSSSSAAAQSGAQSSGAPSSSSASRASSSAPRSGSSAAGAPTADARPAVPQLG